MKKLFSIIAFLLFGLFACSEDSPDEYTESDGQILGQDFRKCMCCGGWFVSIEVDTLRIFNMPTDFEDLLRTLEAPVDVVLRWKKMEDGCGEIMKELIEIDYIRRRQQTN